MLPPSPQAAGRQLSDVIAALAISEDAYQLLGLQMQLQEALLIGLPVWVGAFTFKATHQRGSTFVRNTPGE